MIGSADTILDLTLEHLRLTRSFEIKYVSPSLLNLFLKTSISIFMLYYDQGDIDT
jgi:hypothetical protein